MLGTILGGKKSKKPKGLTNFGSPPSAGVTSDKEDVEQQDEGGRGTVAPPVPGPDRGPRKASKMGGSNISKKGKFAGKGTARPGRRSLRVR